MLRFFGLIVVLIALNTAQADIESDLKQLRSSNDGNSKQALELIQSLESRWEEFESDEQKATFYIQKSFFYVLKSENEKATAPLNRLLELPNVSEESRLIAFNLLSQIKMDLNEYQEAFNYLFKGLAITPIIKGQSEKFNSYHAAANIFVELEAYEEALDYALKAKEVAVTSKNNENLCYAKALITGIFLKQDPYEDHYSSLKKTLEYCKVFNITVIDAHLYKNIGHNYFHHEQLEQAELSYKFALEISKTSSYLPEVLQMKLGLSQVYLAQGFLDKAKILIDEVLSETAIKTLWINRKEAMQLLASYYDKIQDFESSHKVLSQLATLHDKILAEQANRNLAYQKVKYSHLDQEAQIKILDQKNELLKLSTQVEEQSKRNFQLFSLMVLIMLAGISIWLWRMKKQKERYQVLSQIDGLTNILSRRYALNLAHEIHHESVVNNNQYCVIIFDLDYFKSINDRFGHAMGDWVLQKVSAKVKSQVRSVDVFGRLGGEEFILILPKSTATDASALTQRCSEAFKTIQHAKLPDDFQITASFGVATKSNGESLEELIIEADNAMYKAKKMGRNQVHIHE